MGPEPVEGALAGTESGPRSAAATGLPQQRSSIANTVDVAGPSSDKPLWYWSFEDLDGQARLLNEWQGPYLVINFWATWCPPCLKEIPSFIALQNKFRNDNVQFIGVAYDHTEAVKEFVAKTEINYPILLGGDDVAVFMRDFGNKIGALPFTAVVDGSGKVVTTHQGEWHQADAEEALRGLLAKDSRTDGR